MYKKAVRNVHLTSRIRSGISHAPCSYTIVGLCLAITYVNGLRPQGRMLVSKMARDREQHSLVSAIRLIGVVNTKHNLSICESTEIDQPLTCIKSQSEVSMRTH